MARSPDAAISFIAASQGSRSASQPVTITDFDGSLRLIKAGPRVTGLYRKAGGSQWTELDTHRLVEDRFRLAFLVRNFTPKTTAVRTRASITVTFDNLVINAAEEILEGEI